MTEKFQELEKAKQSVRWLLDHPDGLSDMHGLAYWAKRVETLRDEIKAALWRAPRVWHITERFGRFYVENQYGGFAGRHTDRAAAVAQGLAYVAQDGDTFEVSCVECGEPIALALGGVWHHPGPAADGSRNHTVCDWTPEMAPTSRVARAL